MMQARERSIPSFRRKPESSALNWTPACAGVTASMTCLEQWEPTT
jgi:hypothetical protein